MTRKTLAKKRATLKRAAQRGILKVLGEEIRRRRKELKLTQLNLGAEAGVSPNVVGSLERGIYNPSLVLLYAVTTRLGVKLSAIFSDVEKGDL